MKVAEKEGKKRTYNLRSVDNALSLLEVFDHAMFELSVTELSLALNLAKSTVSRLLLTLSKRGYVVQNSSTGKYTVGLKPFEIGSIAVAKLTPRETARPYLEELMHTTGETVHMGVLDQGEVVYIEKIESSQPLSMYSKIGRRAPVHATSIGKVLLAYQTAGEIQKTMTALGELTAFTPKTIVNPRQFSQELGRVRAAGFAVDDEEFAEGLRCVAAPVMDYSGKVVAAVGIGGAAFRFADWENATFLHQVQSAAQKISFQLGFQGINPAGTNDRDKFW